MKTFPAPETAIGPREILFWHTNDDGLGLTTQDLRPLAILIGT